MQRTSSIFLISFVFLAACDGGAGFNGGGAPPPGAGAFTINSGNAATVTAVAYQSALASGEFAGLADSTGLTADAGGVNKTVLQGKAGGLIGQITQNVPIGPDVQPCAVSGQVTFSADVVDPFALAAGIFSVGDTFRVVYTACDDGLGEVVDGTVDLVVEAFAGDLLSGAFELTMAMVATSLQVTTATDVLLSNGDATASINTLEAPFVRAEVHGDRMETSNNSSSEVLTAYNSTQTVDGNLATPPYTMTAGGTLDSSQLAGVVSYSTPVQFEGLGANYPHTGEFLVESANSSARLVAIDDVNVRIDIDNDRDGTIDEMITMTWAELLGG